MPVRTIKSHLRRTKKGKRIRVKKYTQKYQKPRGSVSGVKTQSKRKTFWKKGHKDNPSWFTGRFNSEVVYPPEDWNVTNFNRKGDRTKIKREKMGRIVGRV